MTVKVVALWGTPGDTEAFDKDYDATHMPLVAALPGLTGAVASKALNGPYFRMAELMFADGDAMQNALGSEEGQALLADAARLQGTYGAKLDVLTVEELARL